MPRAFHSAAYRRFRLKLRTARADSELTQREVAKRLRKAVSFAAKIESGERRVDFIELQALAKLYRKPIAFFED